MQYVYIDKVDNNRVLQWIDTDLMSFNLPPEEHLIQSNGAAWPEDRGEREYMLSGQQFVPYVPSPRQAALPSNCTPAQGLVALFALKNITEDHVIAAISQIPDPVQQYTAKIGYQRATTWERNSPTMLAMSQLLQLSEQDLDALFTYAAGVNV